MRHFRGLVSIQTQKPYQIQYILAKYLGYVLKLLTEDDRRHSNLKMVYKLVKTTLSYNSTIDVWTNNRMNIKL